MELTQEQAALVGREFRRVVLTNGWAAAITVIQEQYQQAFFTTTPMEADEREAIYAQAKGFENMINTINSFVAIAEAEMAEGEEDETF